MTDDDKAEFWRILSLTFRALPPRTEPSRDVAAYWFKMLECYPLESVRAAFGIYGREGDFQPTPAAIIRIIDAHNPSGWPTADEAWSIALQADDESVTVVWLDEIGQAKLIADPALEIGDKFGARNAFVSAYERMVTDARRAGQVPRWYPTLGTDAAGREHAIRAAVAANRLPATHLDALPAPASMLSLPSPDETPRQAACKEKTRALLRGLIAEMQIPEPAAVDIEARKPAMVAEMEDAGDPDMHAEWWASVRSKKQGVGSYGEVTE